MHKSAIEFCHYFLLPNHLRMPFTHLSFEEYEKHISSDGRQTLIIYYIQCGTRYKELQEYMCTDHSKLQCKNVHRSLCVLAWMETKQRISSKTCFMRCYVIIDWPHSRMMQMHRTEWIRRGEKIIYNDNLGSFLCENTLWQHHHVT